MEDLRKSSAEEALKHRAGDIDTFRQKEFFKVRILEMDFPYRGAPPQTGITLQKLRILNMDSPEGETPQTEGADIYLI